MSRTPARAALSLALLAAACSGAPRPAAAPAANAAGAAAPAAPAEESGEARVARMLAPETTAPLSPQAVEAPGGAFRATAQGSAAVSVRADENRFVVSIPVGGRSPVECVVFPETIDLANGLRLSYEAIRRNVAQFELHAIDAGFVGDSPYIDLQFLYLVDSPQGRLLGHVKLRGANVGERGLVCTHDEPGFVRTFDRATRPLLEAPAASPPIARYVILVDDHPSGVATTRRSEGAVVEEARVNSTLLPRSATDLAAFDTASVENTNGAGEVVYRVDIANVGGEVSRLQLRRNGATRRYHVEGRDRGRDIAGDLTPPTALLSISHCGHRAWQTLGGDRAPDHVEFATWSRSEPLAVTTVSFRLERRVDPERLWLVQRHGQDEGRVLLGPGFASEESVSDVAGHTVAMRRVAP